MRDEIYRQSVRAAVRDLPRNALRMRFKSIMTQPGMWPTIESEAVTYREQRDAAVMFLQGRAQGAIDRLRRLADTEDEN
jgi:hypothetical protein